MAWLKPLLVRARLSKIECTCAICADFALGRAEAFAFAKFEDGDSEPLRKISKTGLLCAEHLRKLHAAPIPIRKKRRESLFAAGMVATPDGPISSYVIAIEAGREQKLNGLNANDSFAVVAVRFRILPHAVRDAYKKHLS